MTPSATEKPEEEGGQRAMRLVLIVLAFVLLLFVQAEAQQQPPIGFSCRNFTSMFSEEDRILATGMTVDVIIVLIEEGRIRNPPRPPRIDQFNVFVGAVYSECLNKPWERVGRVIVRLLRF